MNLLRIQDALKDASDQQLVQMMQAPDSTAPSYLVLSELRRRKDMRAQQPPEGQPNRTVAEELVAQDDGGIRNIVAHDEPEAQDGADEMAAGGLASLRRYAEGGVVRMQTGGQPPMPLSDLRDEDVLSYYDYFMGQQRPLTQAQVRSGRIGGVAARNPAVSSPYDFVSIANELDRRAGITPPQMFSPQNEGAALLPASRSGPGFSSEPGFSSDERIPPAAPPGTETRVAPSQEPAPRIIPPGDDNRSDLGFTPPAQQPPRPGQPAARPAQPAAPAAQPAQGIGALRPTGAQGDEPAQSSVQFTDRLSPLFERMREGRVDASARRNEALNMAMIEAGLRIASSRNPSLAGALGEGAAPAVQSYGQQLGQIRADQRQDMRDELQGALAQNQNDYYRGRLSQQEFATRQQMIIEQLRQSGETGRTMLREDRADARNAATISGQRTPANVAELQYLEQLRITNPPAYEAAMRARQTGASSEALQAARVAQDRERILFNDANRANARRELLLSGNRNPTSADIDTWIMSRFGTVQGSAPATGRLPVSNTPTGPGGVVSGVR